jgi:hypothetical protein
MTDQQQPTPTDAKESEFIRDLDRRLRRWRVATHVRNGGLQSTWSVALLAGAGVPLVQSLGWSRSVASVLGFVVVVASGAERLFARTADQAEALDNCRRGLESERRLYSTAAGSYTGEPDSFRLFVERTEEITAEFDRRSLAAHRDHAETAA